ncbi:hypothetical protein VI817_008747 [Penicillium citrinum]|uniref:Uncharacterized protein n=1 Tax=Penicillium hetheringtonii TaxID=911720 RepID=A0AAD6DJ28_9EURO|nr:hypothetical protein N7450_005742 [Penicillium hetheringtonii]KAK5789624.1 hypothetical protein VI817_008747 [Penicillium citrinum]
MQYKTLAALLFASAAIAAPAAETTSSATLDDSYDDSDYPEYAGISIPTSVLEILETAAAPTAWANSMYTDSAFVNAEASRIANDQYPAWVSSLPDSAQTYVEQELKAEASMYIHVYNSETVSWGTSFPASTTAAASSTQTDNSSSGSSATTTKSGSQSATETVTDSSSKASSSKAATTSGTASGSQSGSSTSTSTGGAPAATGGIAMSLAGAAGVLGLALAL